jgi:hypothetical protein
MKFKFPNFKKPILFPLYLATLTQFEGWRYRVLRSGHPAFQADDGSYLDKLALDNVHVAHSGVYICIATNEAGYQYREASVNVISGKTK